MYSYRYMKINWNDSVILTEISCNIFNYLESMAVAVGNSNLLATINQQQPR